MIRVLDSKHGGLYYVKENSVRKCRRSDTGFGVDRQVSVAGGYRMHTRRISAAGTRGGRPSWLSAAAAGGGPWSKPPRSHRTWGRPVLTLEPWPWLIRCVGGFAAASTLMSVALRVPHARPILFYFKTQMSNLRSSLTAIFGMQKVHTNHIKKFT